MFDHKHYVPILKGKAGDFWALRHLKPASREFVTPVIEVVRPSPGATESNQLKKTAANIKKAWPDRPAFVDMIWRENVPLLPSGQHVVDGFFEEARSQALHVIPVTGLTRIPAYQEAIKRVVEEDGRGMAIRLSSEEFDEPDQLRRVIDRLLVLVKLKPSEVDIILDFGSVVSTGAGVIAGMTRNEIQLLPYLTDWRTLTTAAGSFPESVTVFPQATWTTLPRKEWLAWTSVIQHATKPTRLPTYGDYVIGDPKPPFDGMANISANLRYSYGPNFFVWRGYLTRTHPLSYGQMHAICADLINRPEYAGPLFSQGDHDIQVKATTLNLPGGAQQWRQWCTNHYIELAVSQISSLP